MLSRPTSRIAIAIVVALALFTVGACSSDDSPLDVGEPQDRAPALPDLSTMTMNLSFFGIDGANPSSARDVDTEAMLSDAGNRGNWINAVVRVLFVQLMFFDAFEEPVGAFAAAIHSIPQLQADGSWLWTFILVEDGIDYGIFLYGKEVGDHVEWRMEVSSNNPAMPLDHFLWFDGESLRDDSGGYWQFYTPVQARAVAGGMAAAVTPGVPSVRIDWQHLGHKDNRLTILVNEVGSEDEGDVLEFRETPGQGSIDYHDADGLEDHNITWYADGSGSITVPDYNNGLQACWDTQQLDAPCP